MYLRSDPTCLGVLSELASKATSAPSEPASQATSELGEHADPRKRCAAE